MYFSFGCNSDDRSCIQQNLKLDQSDSTSASVNFRTKVSNCAPRS